MTTSVKQLLLVSGTIGLSAILYFTPQKVRQDETLKIPEQGLSFKSLLQEAKGQLKRQELDPINKAEAALSGDPENLVLLDSMGKLWDRTGIPVISAHYYELVAEKKPSETNWINVAFRYFDSFKMSGDSLERNKMLDKAISAYKKVLEFNPKNLDAKTDLGICYVEGTPNPMQGITLLREVVQENPDHENAQFNLGVLSVRSGQYDKAIVRFEKVLTLNPKRVEARVLLGRCYMLTGQKEKALQNLEMTKNQSSEPSLVQEVNSLISQINNH